MPVPKSSTTKLDDREWEAVQQLFHAALQLPQAERMQWVAAQPSPLVLRLEVESLLRSLDRHVRLSSESATCEEPVPSGRPEDRLTGELCGPYRLVRFIARGGMGWVYEAVRHSGEFRHRAAIKVIPSLFGPEMLERFRREKQILADMNHPSIAHLLDGGLTERGLSYLAMEYVDGEPLTTYASERLLDRRARIQLFLQVCDAVRYAHERRVVHRDIKPGNILVTSKGEAKLLDFGIAKLLEPDEPEAVTLMRAHTPFYASPEQLRGESAGTRSDIYQMGVLLAELLTCQTRGVGQASGKALRKTLGPDLASILLKATEETPESRYDSVAALAEDLRGYLSGVPVTANPRFSFQHVARKLARHGSLVGAGAVLAIVLCTVGLLLHLKRQTHEDEQRRRNALLTMFNNRPGTAGLSELDPSEMVWVYKRFEELNRDLEEAKRADPQNPSLLEMLGRAYIDAGLLAWSRYTPSLGDIEGAETNLSRARANFEAGAQTDPTFRQFALTARARRATLFIEKGQGWLGLEEIVKTILAERELNTQHWSPNNALELASHLDMLSDWLGGQNWWQVRQIPQPYADLIGVRAFLLSDQTALWLYRAAVGSGSLNKMESGLVEMQLGRLEHASGMWEEGKHTLQLAQENVEALRGTEPVASHQRRIDSTHYAICRALADERDYLRAESECKAAIGNTEIRAARHPQNRFLQETLANRELDTASVLADSGRAGEARRRAERGLRAMEQDAALPRVPSYALDFAAQRLLTVTPPALRNPALAATYAARAVDVSAGQVPAYLVTLAVAQQACGKSNDAVRTARQAITGQQRVLRTIAPLFESLNRPDITRLFLQTNERLTKVEKEF